MSDLQLSATAPLLYNLNVLASTDVELMLGVKAGDEACFERLLLKYRAPLLSFLYRMVRDRAAAEDLAQETFLRVYRARKTYAAGAKFTTWLFRIATNLALNSLRDGRHRRAELSIDGEDAPGAAPPVDVIDRAPGMEQRLLDRERARLIWLEVQALPEKQRAAVLLHKFQSLGYDEIARVLGCSESALKSLLFRAYETLRVRLAPLAADSVGVARKGRLP